MGNGPLPYRTSPHLGYCVAVFHHPHIHCVVPTGGLSPDRAAWVSCREDFFLPVRVLSRVFRGKFIALLKRAFARGELEFHGSLTSLAEPAAVERLLNQSVKHDWVVYAKRPFGGPNLVLKYLARYTHRVAISNWRLLRLHNGRVSFAWRDYAHGNRQSTMTLTAVEFIRRFLLHVLPSSFVKIRYYGFMANRCRRKSLQLCRQLLGQSQAAEAEQAKELPAPPAPDVEPVSETVAVRCPVCREGHMRIIGRLQRPRHPRERSRDPPNRTTDYHDSS